MATGTEELDIRIPDTESDGRAGRGFRAGSGNLEKELRLGLVCYGGVSLAIYMHGVTSELQRLVQASVAYCRNPAGPNPFPPRTTEAIYWDALAAVARTGDRPALRVVIDVISGTSAGGINGVALAKALAHALRQDPVRTIWFEKASLFRLLWRSPMQIYKDRPMPPLSGRSMMRWAHQALSAMNGLPIETPKVGSLVPPGHELDLFITTTDFGGYRRTLDIYDPMSINDREHRHVFRFCYDGRNGGTDHFGSGSDRALAFAIRCTSSFPGAFPPVNLAELDDVIGPLDAGALKAFHELYFHSHLLEKADPASANFIDGGVLNNRPFDHAVQAILERRADHQVDRRLVFIEPHPAIFETEPSKRPGWLATLFAALSDIPRHQPIADALLHLARHNRRVIEIKRLIKLSEPEVERLIAGTAAKAGLGPDQTDRLYALDLAAIDRWATIVQDEACRVVGPTFRAYQALKMGEVVGDLAAGICALLKYPLDSRPADLVHRVLQHWAEGEGLIATTAEQEADPRANALRRDFLRCYDINFRRRRLRFLIRSINNLYHPGLPGDKTPVPARAQLDPVKRGLYDLIDILRAIQSGDWVAPEIKAVLQGIFAPDEIAGLDAGSGGMARGLKDFMERHGGELRPALGRLGEGIRQELQHFWTRQTESLEWLKSRSGLPPAVLQHLFERYVGFAHWDALVYPLMAVSGLADLDEIEVVRISPSDTVRLEPRGAEQRLKGVKVGHFGAFLGRVYRENDFLWGRLDGVERLLAILGDVAKRQGGNPLNEDFFWRGFAAVLTTERPHMSRRASRSTLRSLSRQVEAYFGSRLRAPAQRTPGERAAFR